MSLSANPLSLQGAGRHPPRTAVSRCGTVGSFLLCPVPLPSWEGEARPPERTFMKEKNVLVVSGPRPQGLRQRVGVCPRQLEQSVQQAPRPPSPAPSRGRRTAEAVRCGGWRRRPCRSLRGHPRRQPAARPHTAEPPRGSCGALRRKGDSRSEAAGEGSSASQLPA